MRTTLFLILFGAWTIIEAILIGMAVYNENGSEFGLHALIFGLTLGNTIGLLRTKLGRARSAPQSSASISQDEPPSRSDRQFQAYSEAMVTNDPIDRDGAGLPMKDFTD